MMNYIKISNILSLFGVLLVGLWLPLHHIGFQPDLDLDILFEVIISAISALNIYLYFEEKGIPFSRIKNWLNISILLDLMGFIPWLTIYHLLTGITEPRLLLINLVVTRHAWKIRKLLDGHDRLGSVAYRLIPLAVVMPLVIHLVTCAWIGLGSGTSGPQPEKTTEYIKGLYWTVTTLATVGYGDISAKTPEQMLFASLVMLIGVGTFGFVLSNVASLLSRADAAREHHMDNLDKIEVFMDSHDIPDDIRLKVRGYYHYVWSKHKGYSDRSILKDLPSKMQAELFYYINKEIISKVPLLSGASEDLLEDMMKELHPKIFVPHEYIFKVNDTGDGIYFIQNGTVDIIGPDQQLVATLHEGAFFGEMALVSDRNRSASAKASSYCDIYVLPKNSFNKVIAKYPEFKQHIQSIIEQRNNIKKDL